MSTTVLAPVTTATAAPSRLSRSWVCAQARPSDGSRATTSKPGSGTWRASGPATTVGIVVTSKLAA